MPEKFLWTVEVEAVQWDGVTTSFDGWGDFTITRRGVMPSYLQVRTPRGWEKAYEGWWIVRFANGEFSVMNNHQFGEVFGADGIVIPLKNLGNLIEEE